MKRVFLICIVVLLTSVLGQGCYTTVDGRTKLGMPFSRDRIVSRYERPVEQVFESAKRVLSDMGSLVGENRIAYTLQARVDNNNVWVAVQEVEPGVTEVVTQARTRGGVGNVVLAAEIDKRIGLQLQAMQ